MQREIQRILIVRTDRIGDVILTLPMARALKQQFPQARVSMLIRRYTAELVQDDPSVDQILFYDNGDHPLPLFHLIAALRTEKFDIVFHTHPRFRVALMTWLARIPLRVGTGYRWYSFLFNKKVYEHRKGAQRHELEYNLNLLKAIDCPVNYSDVIPSLQVKPFTSDKMKALIAEHRISPHDKIVLLHPGSGGSARDWGAENFGELGRRLLQIPEVKIIITGGEGEDEIVQRVQSRVGASSVAIVNKLSLGEYAALAKLATLFISNSTGTIHIAAAVGTQVIGLYPQLVPLSAARWGPYTKKKVIFTPKNRPGDCKRCTGEKDSFCECMNSITVDEVFEAASKCLKGEQMQYSESVLERSSLQGDNV